MIVVIKIGELECLSEADEKQGVYSYDVPHLIHADMNDSEACGNYRTVVDVVLKEFVKQAHGENVFWNALDGLLCTTPGYQLLHTEQFDEIRQLRIAREALRKGPPGFHSEVPQEPYDGVLARLLWFEWWIDWALTHCRTPVILNL